MASEKKFYIQEHTVAARSSNEQMKIQRLNNNRGCGEEGSDRYEQNKKIVKKNYRICNKYSKSRNRKC